MLLRVLLVAMVTVGIVLAEDGFSSMDDDDWGYQWYIGEPFHFYCNSSNVAVTSSDNVTWTTPSKETLLNNHDDPHWSVKAFSGIDGYELTLKNVQESVSGIYVCHVYNKTNAVKRGQAIFGMNVHSEKYRDMTDKYRHNIIVAFIATAVFIVPFGTVCFVFHFQHLTPEQKEKKRDRRRAHKKYGDGGPNTDDIQLPYKVPPSDNGAYDNTDFNTQL